MRVHSAAETELHLASRASLADALAAVLAELGFTDAFGIGGGAVMPMARALASRALRVVHCRHEAGAAFAAVEASLVSNRPAAVFTTTGPGITNALTGMAAARWEGARTLLLSGATSAPHRGRWAFQETSPYTAPAAGLFAREPIFHFAHVLEHPAELPVVARRLAAGFARPEGFVAHLGLPLEVQVAGDVPAIERSEPIEPACASPAVVARVADRLRPGGVVLWVGFGARGASREVRALAERTGALVICSPRGKGIFPEDHPQFAGVTGLGGHPGVAAALARGRARVALVLGTRLGEFTSFWSPDLVPPEGFIHVDLDPAVPGSAYPTARTTGVVGEIGRFLRSLLDAMPADGARRGPRLTVAPPRHEPTPRRAPVRSSVLMAAIQRRVVERSDAVVLTEAGNSFAWGSQHLRFAEPGRYRVSTGFGSMGQATAGVVGAAIGRGGKAVAVVGDGAMLMNSEVSTAAQYGVPAVWIVLNDARYGMVAQGMRTQGWTPLETAIPETDFAAIARAMGADGERVFDEADLDAAIDRAMSAPGPFVLDVRVDADEEAPIGSRIQHLIEQGACTGDPA